MPVTYKTPTEQDAKVATIKATVLVNDEHADAVQAAIERAVGRATKNHYQLTTHTTLLRPPGWLQTIADIMAAHADWGGDTLDAIARVLHEANLLEDCPECGQAKAVNKPCHQCAAVDQ